MPGGFTDLLGVDDVDSIVAERGLRSPFFRLVKDGTPVKGATKQAVAGSTTISDLADPEAVRQLHADGATLVLQSLHRIWPPVVEFCRELAAELGHQTQCNAYVTPAGNAQGFAYHHDTHDVFVLQVAGRKRWQVHEPVVTLPTRSQGRSGSDLVAPGQSALIDTELAPGDALYLPRGYVHAAQTTDSSSVHLTVGVLATTWYDVLRDVTTLAAEELTYRHALPVAPLDVLADDPELAAGVLQQAAAWLAALPAEQVRTMLVKRLRKAQVPEPLGMLAQAAAAATCDVTTTTRPRRGLRPTIDVDEVADRVRVVLPGKTIELPASTADALRQVLSSTTTVADLAVAGTEVDAAGAVVLVRRLIHEGALVAVT